MLRKCLGMFLPFLFGGSVLAQQEQPPVPAVDLREAGVEYEYVILYPSGKDQDPEGELKKLLADEYPEYKLLKAGDDPVLDSAYVSYHVFDKFSDYDLLPNKKQLKYFSRQLKKEDLKKLSRVKPAISVYFSAPIKNVSKLLKESCDITLKIQEAVDGLIWDVSTRELYGAEDWKENRCFPDSNEIPEVVKHTKIHAYKDGRYLRMVTLGMDKFGLPDLVINQTAHEELMGLMILFSQALVENPVITTEGQFDLKLARFQNRSMKEKFKGMSNQAKLSLYIGFNEPGDNDNRLIELKFDRYEHKDKQVRQLLALQELTQEESDDKAFLAKEETEGLKKAKAEVKKKLTQVRTAFNKGLKPGENVFVKAPFDAGEKGKEWMWVKVISWKGEKIEGQLNNDPNFVKGLKAGQTVQVKMGDIFDYLYQYPDGSYDGNETSKYLK